MKTTTIEVNGTEVEMKIQKLKVYGGESFVVDVEWRSGHYDRSERLVIREFDGDKKLQVLTNGRRWRRQISKKMFDEVALELVGMGLL